MLEVNHFHSRLGASQESKYYTLHSTNGEHGPIRSGQLPKKKERQDRDGHTPIFGAKQLWNSDGQQINMDAIYA